MNTNRNKVLLIHHEVEGEYFLEIPFAGWTVKCQTVDATLNAWAIDPEERYLCVLVHEFIYLINAEKIGDPSIIVAEQVDYPYGVRRIDGGFIIDYEMWFDAILPSDNSIRHYNVDEAKFELKYIGNYKVEVATENEGKGNERSTIVDLRNLPAIALDNLFRSSAVIAD